MGSKKYHDADWLREKYHAERMTLREIADLCGVTGTTIGEWMDRHGIERRDVREAQRPEGRHTDREWLAEQYHGKGRSLSDIADECDVNAVTIMNWMDRHNIPRRDASHHKRTSPAQYTTEENGYERVASKHNGDFRQARIHQLVAIANGADPHKVFSGGKYECHHKNRIPWDNRPENIELLDGIEHDEIHAADRERAPTGEWL